MAKKAHILYQDKRDHLPGDKVVNWKDSADCAKNFLRRKGFAVSSKSFGFPSTLESLLSSLFPDKADLMIWYSHGGWDGPSVFHDPTTQYVSQVSPSEPEEWVQLMSYFKWQLNPHGIFVAHSCHSAGSDRLEKKYKPDESGKIWVRDVAKYMEVYAVGQAGSAGAAHLVTVNSLLEFALTGNAKGYPFHAYAPGGVRITKPSEWPRV